MKNKVSAKEIYFWNLLGNLMFAGSSAIFMMIVSRLSSAKMADVFSLAYGIAGILVVLGLFQVRTYQGTDVTFKHSFTSYMIARVFSITLMLITLFPYLFLVHFDFSDTSKLAVVVLYVLFRMCEAISDLFQGLFQQHERLDIAGKSMTIRYGASIFILLISLVVLKSLEVSLLILFLVNFVFVWIYDFPKSLSFDKVSFDKSTIRLQVKDAFLILKGCIPLFISGFLLAYIFNEPKIAIDKAIQLGKLAEGLQRNYNILFMPVFFMSLFILILRPLTTSLAIQWQRKEYAKFDRTVKQIGIYLLGGGAILTMLAFLIGTPVLSIVFGVDLAGDALTLTILVFSGILYSVGIVLGDILTIFRMQRKLILVYLLMFIVSIAITNPFVMSKGLLGASYSFLFVMLIYSIGSYLTYIKVRKWKGKL